VAVIGHGRRRKQAHDAHHVCIRIRRGLCRQCHVTITVLPAWSLPYTHYSLATRAEAFKRGVEGRIPIEQAAPPVQDADRVADPSTLRRWFHILDSSRPAFSFLRPMLQAVAQWLGHGEQHGFGSLRLSWATI